MGTVDWSRTALGPVSGWPRSLVSAVNVMLEVPSPMIIFWGEELIQLYNDGYSFIMGPRHPKYFGAPYRDCWPDTYPLIMPLMQRTLAGEGIKLEKTLFPVTRHGFYEEAYFTFTFSPLRDDAGKICGILQPVNEVTETVLAERRAETLRALALRADSVDPTSDAVVALQANPKDLPFALVYLRDETTGALELVARSGDLGEAVSPVLTAAAERAAAGNSAALLDDVSAALGGRKLGPWPEACRSALVLPLQRSVSEPARGAVVFGLSSALRFDERYRGFLEVAAGQLLAAIEGKRLLRQAQQRAEKLAELDRAKTAFFSNVSHEFRTPLTLMLGPVEDLLSGAPGVLSPAQQQQLELLHRNALRLQKLVNNLLDFSRIEAGRMQASYEPVDLAELTRDLASTFRSTVERAGLSLKVECEAPGAATFVDREMWEKIVLNLLSNAFKFTFAGGITVKLRPVGDRVELTVRDTGVGIPAASLPHLFERFHRVAGARARTHEGSGIGLALVQELVGLHGGSIRAESTEGEGTAFTVSLPVGSGHLAHERISAARSFAPTRLAAANYVEEASRWLSGDAAPESRGDERPVAVGQSSARIVLADDNADMRDYVQRLLRAQGWEVEAVADGATALERIEGRAPDLVLADVMMPGLDGLQLLARVKGAASTRALPVVLLSARAGEEARIAGLEAGADDYLVKPFSARELVARVQSQLALAKVRSSVAAYRTQLYDVFQSAPAAIAVVRGKEHVFELVNPPFRALRAEVDFIGKRFREVALEQGREQFAEKLDRVFSTGQSFAGDEVVAKRRGRDGSLEDGIFNVRYEAVRSFDGSIEGVVMFAFDVTELVTSRRKVEGLVDELKLADQRKDEFLAMLAHELRNPMAAISMALSLLERVGTDAAKAARHRETAQRQMSNLVRLVDDLLDVARITKGKIELRRESGVDLANVVQAALAATRQVIEARKHAVSVEIERGPFRAHADSTRLEQVVVNLLTNASKYTEPGGTISVRLSLERDGGSWAVLSVKDTGRGLPKAMLEQVFELFVQVSPTLDRGAGGLGLGLTLVKRLVEMHGGTVVALSDGPGHGTELKVRLPLEAEQVVEGAGAPKGPASATVSRSVLVIEDSEDVLAPLKDLLEDLGHRVAVATRGDLGLSRLLELRPDVALVDVGLPGLDGYEVARRARADGRGAGLFLVALTGYGGPEAVAKARAAGFDLHLTKPIDVDALAEVINRGKR